MSLSKSYFPRERAKDIGVEHLTDYELLALILRTGKKGEDAIICAKNMLELFCDTRQLAQTSIEQLKTIPGIGESKAISVLAAIELGKRTYKQMDSIQAITITTPKDCVKLFQIDFQYHYQECFLCIFLNAKNQIISKKEIYRGGLHNIIVHPREIFRAAISVSAAAIILLHNHPSGDTNPSHADITTTQKLLDSSQIIGIPILDHIIIGKNNYTSMKENASLVFK